MGEITVVENGNYVPASWVTEPEIPHYIYDLFPENFSRPYKVITLPFTVSVPIDAVSGDYTLVFSVCGYSMKTGQRINLCVSSDIGVTVGIAPGGGIARIEDFSKLTEAMPYTPITICSGKVYNDGTSDKLFIKLIDRDDSSTVGYTEFHLNGGDYIPFSITDTMPNKNWNLRFEVGHFVDGVTANPTVDDSMEFTITATTILTGSVFGSVKDENDNPIVGATIEINGLVAMTDDNGNYIKENIQEGDYTITASADGYQSESQSITIVGGEAIEKHFVLKSVSVLSGLWLLAIGTVVGGIYLLRKKIKI